MTNFDASHAGKTILNLCQGDIDTALKLTNDTEALLREAGTLTIEGAYQLRAVKRWIASQTPADNPYPGGDEITHPEGVAVCGDPDCPMH